MGKVGSKTIEHACKRLDCFDVSHTHALSPMIVEEWGRQHDGLKPHMWNSPRMHREVLEPGRPFKLITATRDPLARNVSAFFQNLDSHGFGKREVIMAAFVSRYAHVSAFLRRLGIYKSRVLSIRSTIWWRRSWATTPTASRRIGSTRRFATCSGSTS